MSSSPRRAVIALLALSVTPVLGMASAARADDAGRRLASPFRPADAHTPELVDHPATGTTPTPPPSPGGPGVMLDLSATTLIPLAVGGAMQLEFWEGLFVRLSGSVIIPAYVDGINDVGQSYGIWDETTASAISELLVDAIVLEGGLGIRPLNGPLELSVSYFLLWSEGPGPAALAMQDQTLSLSVYAVHGELAIRMPLGDAIVMRIGVGWLHSVGRDVTIRAAPGESEEARLIRTTAETMVGSWISQYGMGPTLTAGLGIHFQ